MADLVYLDLWINNFTASNMLQHWVSALVEFPVSATSPGIRSLAIYPICWSETPVLQQSFQEGADVEHVAALAGEWLHADCAYEAEMSWDLWLQASPEAPGKRRQVPSPVSLVCFGREFENEGAEGCCDLQVNFGLDYAFVAGLGRVDALAGQPRDGNGETTDAGKHPAAFELCAPAGTEAAGCKETAMVGVGREPG